MSVEPPLTSPHPSEIPERGESRDASVADRLAKVEQDIIRIQKQLDQRTENLVWAINVVERKLTERFSR